MNINKTDEMIGLIEVVKNKKTAAEDYRPLYLLLRIRVG